MHEIILSHVETELWKIKRNQNVNAKVQSVFRLFFSGRKHFPKPARQYSNILSAVKQAVYIYNYILYIYTSQFRYYHTAGLIGVTA